MVIGYLHRINANVSPFLPGCNCTNECCNKVYAWSVTSEKDSYLIKYGNSSLRNIYGPDAHETLLGSWPSTEVPAFQAIKRLLPKG